MQVLSRKLLLVWQIEFTKPYFHCSMQHILQYTGKQSSSRETFLFLSYFRVTELVSSSPIFMYFIHRKYEGCFNLNFDIRSHILAPFLKFRRTCHLRVLSVFVCRQEDLENNLVGRKTCVNNSCNNLCLLFYIDELFGLVFQ